MSAPLSGSSEREEPSALDALGVLLLIGGLVAAVLFALGDPTPGYRFQARQAAATLAEGRYTEAVSAYEKLAPRYRSTDVFLGLSYAYLARRDPARSEIEARMALTSSTPDLKPAAWAQLGRALSLEGDSDGARSAWQTAVSLAQPYSGTQYITVYARSARWHLASQAWDTGDFTTAQPMLEQLLGSGDIYAASGALRLAQLHAPVNNDISPKMLQTVEAYTGSHKESDGYESTGAAVPDLGVAGLAEGIPYSELVSTAAALRKSLADIGEARAKGTGEGGLAAAWGSAYLAQGETRLAKAQLERATALEPDISDIHAYLGLALSTMGSQDAGIAELIRAVALDPSRALPHQALAGIYTRLKQWDNASAQLSALKRLQPNSVAVHLQLAQYYVARSLYDAAEDEYIAARDQQRTDNAYPPDLDAALALSRFYTDVRGLGCARGLSPAQESLSHHPGDPSSLDAVGWALVQCGKAQEALDSLEKVVGAVGTSPRFRFHLGRAYALLGRDADAREQFNRVIDLDPKGSWEQLARAELPQLAPAP